MSQLPCPKWHNSYVLTLLWTENGHDHEFEETIGPIIHFKFQKGAREYPICGRFATSMCTVAEPALNAVTQLCHERVDS